MIKIKLLLISTLILFGCSQLPVGERLGNVNPENQVLIVGDIIFYDGKKDEDSRVLSFDGFKMVIKDLGFGAPFDYPAVNSIEGSSKFAFTVKPGIHEIDSVFYRKSWGEKKRINVPVKIKFNAVQGEVVNIGLIVVTKEYGHYGIEIIENQEIMQKFLRRHSQVNSSFKHQPLTLIDDPRMIFIEDDEYEESDDEFEEVNWEVSI